MATARSSATCAVHLPVPFLNDVHERLSRLRIDHPADLRRQLDEERLQRTAIPRFEHAPRFGRREAQSAMQDVVDLGDDLHVAVFDAVVDHLHEMARAIGPHVRHARPRVGLRGNRLEDVLDPRPCRV